jgi:hypothetical protein
MKNNLIELTLKKGKYWEVWSGWNFIGKASKKIECIKIAHKYSRSLTLKFDWILREEPKFYAMGGEV